MKSFHKLVTLLLVLGVFWGCQPKQEEQFTAKFVQSDTSLFEIKKEQQYTFGYLEVLENRAKPNGATIKLPIYIFKSRSKQAPKDPIIYLVGGPGSSSMGAVPYMNYYRYLDDRDFIVFEQRGTEYAQPHLDCPEWSAAQYEARSLGWDDQLTDSLYQKAAAQCRERLLDKGIDLNAYNTKENAADVEDLRLALGIEKYNLLTLSYGTKIAQVLMRDYPEGIRSVVMDSPLPLEVSYDEESVQNLLETYDKIFSACALDRDCQTAYPNLKNRFYTFLEEKTNDPLLLTVDWANDGNTTTFYLQGKDFINLLYTSSSAEMPKIPSRIAAILSGDMSFVKAELASLLEYEGDGAGIGMRLSVWCVEESPFVSREVIAKETQKYPAIKGLSPATFKPEICDIWGVKPADGIENQAVKSTIPTLLISGEYDNDTPVKWAKQMNTNLAHSFHMIFKGWHHTPTTYWDNPCGMEVAHTFFNNPLEMPDIDCFRNINRVKFETK